jgi:hypothetical protein
MPLWFGRLIDQCGVHSKDIKAVAAIEIGVPIGSDLHETPEDWDSRNERLWNVCCWGTADPPRAPTCPR